MRKKTVAFVFPFFYLPLRVNKEGRKKGTLNVRDNSPKISFVQKNEQKNGII